VSKVDLGQRYELRRELGSGGAGRVFLVHDRHLGRDLALKRLHRGGRDPVDLEAFKEEFSLLARIEHPAIARAFDFGYLGGRPYFTTEYVTGMPLDAWSPGAAKDPSGLLSRILDIAEALAFLHRNGILHLDVKPGNIIMPDHTGRSRAVLVDFGLFRRAFTAPPRRLKGTMPYMAPEYFRGERLGAWTDVYALGVTLYWVLTGAFPRYPVSARPRTGSAFRLEPPAPQRIGGRTPAELESVIFKCLALDPAARYPSGVELLQALRALEKSAASRRDAAPPAVGTIGRRSELERIESFLSTVTSAGGPEASAAGPIALVLTGVPGMGQSHLLREVKVRAQTRGIQVSLETGYPGQPTPPGSLLRFLGLSATQRDARAVRRWRDFLSGLERRRSAREHAGVEGERRLRRASEMATVVETVRRPTIIVVDGLQLWDKISMSLVVDLVRHIGDMDPVERPPLRLVLGYREEGPCAPLLRELTGYLLQDGKAEIITLGPLDVFETLELHRCLRGKKTGGEGAFELFNETGGCPAKIHERARGGVHTERSPDVRLPAGSQAEAPPFGNAERLILHILLLLERPATSVELARMSGLRRRALKDCLSRLEAALLV
jgi:eukaryotic-like serine/threonine-protein kinase